MNKIVLVFLLIAIVLNNIDWKINKFIFFIIINRTIFFSFMMFGDIHSQYNHVQYSSGIVCKNYVQMEILSTNFYFIS